MNSIDRWVERCWRRLRFGQFLQRLGELLAGFLFVFGTVVLLVKLLRPDFWPHVLWLGLGAMPLAVSAWWLTRRDAFTRDDSVTLLDRRLNAGGLLMMLSEAPDRAWNERLPQLERVWRDSLPRFRPRRFARLTVLPLLFALGACAVPAREARTEAALSNTVGRQTSRELEELLQSLDDAAVLQDDDKQQLRDEIEKLIEETNRAPLTHEKWETVDALKERMRLQLHTSSLTIAKARQAAALLAQGTGEDGGELSVERAEQLEQHVFDALQKLADHGGLNGASPELREQLEKLSHDVRRQLPQDKAERQQLLDELKEFLDREAEKLSQLGDHKDYCPHCNGPQQGGT
jgi:hypothetical protein